MDTATELLIRITPRSNTIQTEFVQKGVRRCKQVSYDTLVESIRGSLEKDLVSSGRPAASPFRPEQAGALSLPSSTRNFAPTSAMPERSIRTFPCRGWCSNLNTRTARGSCEAGWASWDRAY